MDPAVYVQHLRVDGARLGAVAKGKLKHQVPTCPDWSVAELVGHVASAHRWFADIVASRTSEGHWDFLEPPDDTGALLAWYEEGLDGLAAVLDATGPDDPIWNWFDGRPAPAVFWHRRVAEETAVHRWDAENAVGVPAAIDVELAADGIDEYIGFVDFGLRVHPVDELSGSLLLCATDQDCQWSLQLSPTSIAYERT